MPELSTVFILSQVAMFLAMGTDFLSLQFKKRKSIYLTLVFSAVLISSHYFFTGKDYGWTYCFCFSSKICYLLLYYK